MDAAVDIRPTYMALAFMSEAAPIRALVGGQGPFELRWKHTLRVPVPAGPTVVVVWSAWVTKRFMGTSHALVDLAPGQVVGLEWRPPNTVFTAGKLTVADVGPPEALALVGTAAAPPGAGPRQVSPPHAVRALADVPLVVPAGAWHPDPAGRWPFRWWDGTAWTDAVSDGTQTASDPLGSDP